MRTSLLKHFQIITSHVEFLYLLRFRCDSKMVSHGSAGCFSARLLLFEMQVSGQQPDFCNSAQCFSRPHTPGYTVRNEVKLLNAIRYPWCTCSDTCTGVRSRWNRE